MEDVHTFIKEFIKKHNLEASHIVLSESCHTVQDAANAIGAYGHEFVKNICMMGADNHLIVAIVKGEDRASTSRVAKALNIERPRLATEEEIISLTGFPLGGIPSFGFKATFLIDPNVTELNHIYTGGGSPYSLVKINVKRMIQVNGGQVVRIRK
ncbi:YbaK/EbsC family protein [Fictibacillus sp. b24]|uniref:aminoacyl-tRNA deacylase n=1 Tax=Fictibacillus sp. b24 TaxID=3055863 RepID=UPI0025A21CF0|nr:YbaK/EbsC family protein [Fictibacillus sp. b24]MDM5316258.1 YbaK/EbsC family protein [Fictibacillus sp. b24]